jgi:phenylacetate-CoA ligase
LNLFDFSLKINGYPLAKAQDTLRAIQAINKIEYSDYISVRKKEILDYHFNNNSFYRNFVESSNKLWADLPVLKKRDLQIPLKERLSKGYNLQNVYINKTSGSTGTPFYFAKDKFTHALTWVIIKNRFGWHGLNSKKQARFYGIPNSFFQNTKERLKDFFANRYRFDVFNLSPNALDKWIENFKKTPYVYLNGYATVILAFAKYLASKNIVLKDICPSLEACVVTSEMCFENDKKIMEAAFGVSVINEYGASELDLIAFENNQYNWIINTESLFVEILDDNNKVLPYREEGRIVITSLYNKAHPFIRYDIGDIGKLKFVNNKTIILEKLIGRKEDIVKLPSGKTSPGLTFYYVTKSIMEDSGIINEIKVFQTDLNTFEIQYSGKEQLNLQQEQNITKALYGYLEPNLIVTYKKVEQIERSANGKLKQFTSLIN